MDERLTPEQWVSLSNLLDQALELPEAARAAWVETLAEPMAAFKPMLRSMLAAAAKTNFLNTLPSLDNAEAPAAPRQDDTLGSYRLIRELGRGGMGTVWLAERADGVLKRPVALKFPHPGFHSRHFLERFSRERDIVASLAHPNIAALFDAGIADGQPYLALEYVEGTPITDYCDRMGQSIRQRLRLFLQVLGAVQYAHSHLVVHRDLKPSNVLVTADGQVKLLDFGIAKILGEGDGKETELTQAGGRVLTPDYASPEQITGQAIGTATDVFVLGVMLFELLAGEKPWRERRVSRGMLEDAILHEEPCRPSEAARASHKMASALRGDLDSIVLKSLRKQPEGRYATADAFAQDIVRFLTGEPVVARPESVWYRARKFLSRHVLAVASASAITLALATGLGLALWQAHIAKIQTQTAEAVENFLEDIFRANSSSQPDPVKARQTTARELLDIGARKIDNELAGVPEAKLHILDTLDTMYADLGLDDQAVDAARKSAALAREVYGGNAPATAKRLIQLASVMHASQQVNEREAVLLEAKRILDRNQDNNSRTRGTLLWNLAQHYQSSDLDKALDYSRQAVQVLRAYPPDSDLAAALYEQAAMNTIGGNPANAEPLLSEAISVSKSVAGDPNPELPRYFADLGDVQQKLLKFEPAEDSLRHALAAARRLNGEDHIDTLETQLRLGLFLFNAARTHEGLENIERAMGNVLRIRGPDDPFYTPQVVLEYGFALTRIGKPEEGLKYISRAVENRRKNRPGTRYLGQMLECQANALLDLGRESAAQMLLDEAMAITKQVNVPPSYLQVEDRVRLLIAAGNTAETGAVLGTFKAAQPAPGTPSLNSLNIGVLRAQAALAQKDAAEGVRQAALVRTQLIALAARPWLKSLEARAALAEGRGDTMLGSHAEALPLFKRAVELRSELLDANSPALADAQLALAACYLDLGERLRAAELLASARKIQAAHRELAREFTAPLLELERRMR